jgi:paraquat-inducible protein A
MPAAPGPSPQPSLAQRHPHLTLMVAPAWALAATLLAAGLLLPAVKVTRLRLFDDGYSILEGVAALWRQGDQPLAALIFAFSVVAPWLKLGALAWLWLAPADDPRGGRLGRWLSTLGKWSMLDVMVVAVIAVSLQGGVLVRIRPDVGVYLFAAAALAAMALALLVDRLRLRAAAG